jgi:hypothetical protein
MGQVINEMAGGPKPGRKIKAVIPGVSSAKVLRAGDLFKLKEREVSLEEIPMDFDSLAAVGSMAGSGGVIVMDDSRDMVWALNNINEFYAHESCGQCTPCREGSLWMKKVTDRMLSGGGVTQDPATLKNGRQHRGPTICAFNEACDPSFRKVPRGIARRKSQCLAGHAGTNRRRQSPRVARHDLAGKAGATGTIQFGNQKTERVGSERHRRIIGAGSSRLGPAAFPL